MLVQILPPGEQARFFQEYPDAEIIPTRWGRRRQIRAWTGGPEYKSRLVARGDLEKNNSLRDRFAHDITAFLELG